MTTSGDIAARDVGSVNSFSFRYDFCLHNIANSLHKTINISPNISYYLIRLPSNYWKPVLRSLRLAFETSQFLGKFIEGSFSECALPSSAQYEVLLTAKHSMLSKRFAKSVLIQKTMFCFQEIVSELEA